MTSKSNLNIWGEKNTEPKPDQKKECFFCGDPATDEQFCPGCGEYVCGICDEETPFGSHDAYDHESEEEEDDE